MKGKGGIMAYIDFTTKEEAEAGLSLNGKIMDDK